MPNACCVILNYLLVVLAKAALVAYHGKLSFDTFSHLKGVLKKSTLADMAQRYPPYTESGTKLIKKMINWLM
jgi:aldehyde dehydrogenase (NAD+)